MKRFVKLLALGVILLLPAYYVRFSLGGLPTNLLEVAVAILAVLTVSINVRERVYPVLKVPFALPIVLILAGIILGVAISDDTRVALGILKGWFLIPLLYYACVATLFTREDLPLLYRAVALNVLLVSLYAIFQWLGLLPLIVHQIDEQGSLLPYLEQKRAVAFFESPNYLAMYLAPLVFLLYPLLRLGGRWRYVAQLAMSLGILAVFLSGSRGGLLALAAGVVTLLSLRLPLGKTLLVMATMLVGTIAVLGVFDRGLSSDNSRRFIWQEAMEQITDQPLTGIGPGQFAERITVLNRDDPVFMQFIQPFALHPHNFYLALWLSGGILAIAGFLYLIYQIIRRLAALGGVLPIGMGGALAALAAVLIHGLFDTTYFKNDLSIIFWLIVLTLYLTTQASVIKKSANE